MNPFPAMMLASSTSQQTTKKHAGGKRRHYLTDYIIITNEYVNPQKPNDKYCYCLACYDLNFEKVKIVNRKKLVKNHLKNCIHFIHKVGGREQADNILNNESSKKLRLDIEEESSDEDDASKVENKNLDQFITRTPTFLKILNITITNGGSFRWVEDKSVIAHYRWLNPHLVLPIDSDSDDEIKDNEHIINVENWNENIQRWANMISEEEEDEIDITLDDDNLEQIINDTDHPAINNDAKWKLKTLFKDDITIP
ncbi:23650_t:CDS:2, partial [Gigaspora rosea]